MRGFMAQQLLMPSKFFIFEVGCILVTHKKQKFVVGYSMPDQPALHLLVDFVINMMSLSVIVLLRLLHHAPTRFPDAEPLRVWQPPDRRRQLLWEPEEFLPACLDSQKDLYVVVANYAIDALLWSLNVQERASTVTVLLT